MPSRLLGIDVGTGGTRAVLDRQRRQSNRQFAPRSTCPFASPQTGWAEQDPHDWWRAACEAVKSGARAVGHSGGRHWQRRFFRPDARRRLARRCRRRATAVAHLVRSADGRRSRGADGADGREPDHRLDLQSRAHQFHPDQVALGSQARAAVIRALPHVVASQGLRSLSAVRRVCHGHGRRLRHAAAGRGQSPLVAGNGQRDRDRPALPSAALRIARISARTFKGRAEATGLRLAHRSSLVQAIRRQAQLEWASSARALCTPPSAPRA